MGIIFNSITYDIALVVIAVCTWYYIKIKSKLSYWKDRGIPDLKPKLLFLDIFAALFGKMDIFKIHNEAYSKLHGNKCGGIFEMNIPTLIVMNPDLVEKVLVKDFGHFHDRGFPSDPENDPLSQNLSGLDGEKWRLLRYKLTPTFTTGKLKGMFEQICNCGENLIKDIEKESQIDKAFDTRKIIGNFSLDVIASCAFGIKLDEDQNKRDKLRELVSVFVKPTPRLMLYFILNMTFPKIAKWTKMKSVSQETEDFIMKLVTDTIQYRKDNKVNRNDFLQLVYNLQQQEENEDMDCLNEDQNEEDDVINQMKYAANVKYKQSEKKEKIFTNGCIAAQAFVFLMAGLESISGSIGFILFCLARYPDVQEKLHKEIDTVLGNHQNEWSYKAVKEMIYLDQVIQETLRMYPSAPELQRVCTEPYKLPDTNAILDKGVMIIVPVRSIHNDPDNYESPEKFDPERFVNNNFKPSGSFLPFGNGPRICIAMRFAVLEMKVCVARIISEYKITLSNKMQLPLQMVPGSFLLTPVGGFWFEFHKKK